MVFAMRFIVHVKRLPDFFQGRFLLPLRHSPFNQLTGAVAYEAADLIKRPLREPVDAQRIIRSLCQIRQRVQQRAVQIKNDRFVLHFLPLSLYS